MATRSSTADFLPLSCDDDQEHGGDEAFHTLLRSLLSIKYSGAAQNDSEDGIFMFFDINNDTKLFSTIHIKRLMQLGFSGAIQPQRIFAKVLDRIIAFQSVKDCLFSAAADSEGVELLNKLLWCVEFHDNETRTYAIQTVEKLTADMTGNIVIFFSQRLVNLPLLSSFGLHHQNGSESCRAHHLGCCSSVFKNSHTGG
jgi:hypothetical protein